MPGDNQLMVTARSSTVQDQVKARRLVYFHDPGAHQGCFKLLGNGIDRESVKGHFFHPIMDKMHNSIIAFGVLARKSYSQEENRG